MSGQRTLLVLGGTVYLSKAVAKAAVERGSRVTVAARGASGEPPEGVEFVRIDRSSPEGVAPLAGRSFDAVVDVSRIPAQVGPVLDALADGAGHWTFVSSISVYADPSARGDRTLEPSSADETETSLELYGRNKVTCENLVRERLGDRAFVPRPGLIVGAGDNSDRLGCWPLRIAEGGEVLAPGRPERQVQWIDVEDLAAWILDAGERGVVGTFDAIGRPIAMERFLHGIADTLIGLGVIEARPEFTWVPQDFLAEHGVNPWAGPDSLGLWLPEPDYDGMVSHDPESAFGAGLATVSLATTIERWWKANADAPRLTAGLTREKEGTVLGIWHDRERTFEVPTPENFVGP
ncbi:NAD-dependent epimerase/dehydratase family protein [Glycomyces salinus]|uniref:NAD-dependent epimerase/dehydratase family protein n=1 Tax=Glycomyces salinus TaxID=980294 RepID=UPI0018EDC31F|nr:NAD-dependent epimerase/dehydratase family protein [Glycomyces salinus]